VTHLSPDVALRVSRSYRDMVVPVTNIPILLLDDTTSDAFLADAAGSAITMLSGPNEDQSVANTVMSIAAGFCFFFRTVNILYVGHTLARFCVDANGHSAGLQLSQSSSSSQSSWARCRHP
jgi:hypothetical protein